MIYWEKELQMTTLSTKRSKEIEQKMASYDKKTKVTTTNIKIKNYTWHIYWYSQLHNWNTNEGKMQTRENQARNQSKTHSVVNDL